MDIALRIDRAHDVDRRGRTDQNLAAGKHAGVARGSEGLDIQIPEIRKIGVAGGRAGLKHTDRREDRIVDLPDVELRHQIGAAACDVGDPLAVRIKARRIQDRAFKRRDKGGGADIILLNDHAGHASRVLCRGRGHLHDRRAKAEACPTCGQNNTSIGIHTGRDEVRRRRIGAKERCQGGCNVDAGSKAIACNRCTGPIAQIGRRHSMGEDESPVVWRIERDPDLIADSEST